MTINGSVKLFETSKALFKNGAAIVTTSGVGQYMLSMDKRVRWESVGSNDATMETITITMPATVTINRIFIAGTNIKDFKILHNGMVDFTNVTTIGGINLAKIDITNNIYDTAYFEFDAVNTNQIIIQAFNTQIVNEEKYITIFVSTEELGTFKGYAKRNSPAIRPNSKVATVESGKKIIQRGLDSFSVNLEVNYTHTINHEYDPQHDVDLIETLFDRNSPFLVWLNGGLPDNFTVIQKGWRLQDIFTVQATNAKLTPNYMDDITTLPPETTISLTEVVG